MECVETRRTPKTDGMDAWRVLKVMEASQRSFSMNGEPVQLERVRPGGRDSIRRCQCLKKIQMSLFLLPA